MPALVLRNDANGIATLTLNRPDKRNAIDRALFREFRAHVRDIESDASIGIVVLRGAGGHFCAGHDLTSAGTPMHWAGCARKC